MSAVLFIIMVVIMMAGTFIIPFIYLFTLDTKRNASNYLLELIPIGIWLLAMFFGWRAAYILAPFRIVFN